MADGTEHPSKWIPITSLLDLAHLGKLLEETGELTGITARCLIQGIDECNPTTGKKNRHALQEEIADVVAMSELVVERFLLNTTEIRNRIERKKAMKRAWHDMLKEDS